MLRSAALGAYVDGAGDPVEDNPTEEEGEEEGPEPEPVTVVEEAKVEAAACSSSRDRPGR